MSDDLTALVRDLSVLSRADRRAILAALQPNERRRIDAVMRGRPPTADTIDPLHSAWFAGLAESASVTPAARAALAADPPAASLSDSAQRRPAGRSLMQAAGGLLGR